jgi:hypothetical protein
VFLIVFIDSKKAFGSAEREQIWKSLEKIGIVADLLQKVKNVCTRTINCVKNK